MATPHKEEPKEEELRRVYLSMSPLHLIGPVFEGMVEVRAHRNIGVAAIGGVGKFSGIPVWEVGGQAVGYPVGHFDHGMQLGAEILYVGASADSTTGGKTVSATATGLATGVFVGYKLATKVGFSFNVQGGVSYLTARGEATSSPSPTQQGTVVAEGRRWLPLLNLNAGWSF